MRKVQDQLYSSPLGLFIIFFPAGPDGFFNSDSSFCLSDYEVTKESPCFVSGLCAASAQKRIPREMLDIKSEAHACNGQQLRGTAGVSLSGVSGREKPNWALSIFLNKLAPSQLCV